MRYLPAFIVDAVLVLVFAAIGRASHEEDPAGFLATAWPFLVALLVGHVASALLPARPRRPWSIGWGLVAWAVTVVGGILLRLASGDTAEVPFIIVATLVLGAFLLGWRGLAALSRRRVAARRSAERADAAASVDAHDDVVDERGGDRTDAGDDDHTDAGDDEQTSAPADASDDDSDKSRDDSAAGESDSDRR